MKVKLIDIQIRLFCKSSENYQENVLNLLLLRLKMFMKDISLNNRPRERLERYSPKRMV